jgi:hypothetical protein
MQAHAGPMLGSQLCNKVNGTLGVTGLANYGAITGVQALYAKHGVFNAQVP